MIRRGQPRDIPAIIALRKATIPGLLNFDVHFDEGRYTQKVFNFIEPEPKNRNLVSCFVSEVQWKPVAVVLAFVMVHPDIGDMIGCEASWLANPKFPGHGRLVLKAAEEWYREQGAKRVFVACNDDRTAKLLDLLGYHQTERVFEKLLCHSSVQPSSPQVL